ncbi:MAG: hypothetical protein F2585_12360 [Actinobacteria bacterium]|nr:hypothetical protein [Actinomycetota bacterium]
MNSRALKATLGAGVMAVFVGVFGLSALSASAQTTPTDPSTTTTSSSTTSTTEAPSTTTTTQASTTTTTLPTTTTTQQRSTTTQQRSTTSTAPRNSSTTSSTSSTTTTTAAPAPVTPSGYSGPSSDGGGWFTSGWKIASIVAGLIAAAGGLAFTTVLYWRQTRPGLAGASESGEPVGPSGLIGPVEPSLAAALRPDMGTGPITLPEPSPGFVTRDDLGLSPS